MTITINGNGTIGGVSVGGLPDGIVDTDMLASAAVTSAKVGSLGTSNLPAGSVLQVVNSWSMNGESTTSTSFVASGYIKASITPSSSSSKVLVIVSGGGAYSQVDASRLFTTIYRNSTTNLGDANYGLSRQQVSASYVQPISIHLLDSPSTTSSTEYKVYFRCHDGNTVYLSFGDSGRTNITLMEIAA